MFNSIFFAVLIVLILSVLYVMTRGEDAPKTYFNQTPKEYIEMVEQRKAARQAAEAMQQSLQQSADKSDKVVEELRKQH